MDVRSSLVKLRRYVEDQDFQGYDPYDALNSPVLRRLAFNRKYLRIAYIQALKRSPLNMRRPLLIRKGRNPKAIGLFLWGYAKLYRAEARDEDLRKIDYLVDLLSSLRSKGYSGNCWGYDFDWQSRAFFVPRGVPTIVNSSFIGHALLDAHRYTGMGKALDLAVSIKDGLADFLIGGKRFRRCGLLWLR